MNSWFQRLQPMVPSSAGSDRTPVLRRGLLPGAKKQRGETESQHKAERPPPPGSFQWPTSFICSLPLNILRMAPNGTPSWWPIPGTWAFCNSPSYPNLNKSPLILWLHWCKCTFDYKLSGSQCLVRFSKLCLTWSVIQCKNSLVLPPRPLCHPEMLSDVDI